MIDELEKMLDRTTNSYARAAWAEDYGKKLLAVAKSAQDCLSRQTDHQARWAMEDIAKALKELEE